MTPPRPAASIKSPTGFVWGVASGDPTETSIVLWSRHATLDSSAAVDWQLWPASDGSPTVAAEGTTSATVGGAMRVHVKDLNPATHYRYRFGTAGEWSPIGSTSTLDPAAGRVRLGIACCARLSSGPLVAYEGLRRAEPDLVVHLGDYIYEDGGTRRDAGETPQPPWECRTAEDYTSRYSQYRREPHLQRLHASAPWVAIPDDHEITDDAFLPENGSAAASAGAVEPPPPGRREAAISAHAAWTPQQPHGNGPTRYDRHVSLGAVADLVILDARYGGRERPVGNGPTPVEQSAPDEQRAHDDRPSMLSEAQWAWLDEVIGAADRPWLILTSQVQVAQLRLGWLPQRSWPPTLRPVVNPDQWDGYPADRERLVALLDHHDVDQVLLLSGDLHARFVTTIERSNGRRLVEVTTPSVTAPTFASLINGRLPVPRRWRAWRLVARWLRLINPHIVDMDLEHHGTTVLDIDADEIRITGLAPDGQPAGEWCLTADGLAPADGNDEATPVASSS